MKGITVDAKTGEIKYIDDGKPEPHVEPQPEPVTVDLVDVDKAIKYMKDKKWI